MSAGNLWGREIGLAKGLFNRAAPHISSAISRAQLHAKMLASKAVNSTISKIQKTLKSFQEGKGVRRSWRRKVTETEPKNTQSVNRTGYLNAIPDKFGKRLWFMKDQSRRITCFIFLQLWLQLQPVIMMLAHSKIRSMMLRTLSSILQPVTTSLLTWQIFSFHAT